MSYKYSVLIPVYNVEKYLSECIDSVLNQTYHNFEIILIDDGSTDASSVICDMYMQKDPRITVHHQSNQGLIMARRKSIELANGDILLFLDSDDFWDSDLLQTVDNIFNEFDCDMVIFNFKRVVNDVTIKQETVFEDKKMFTNSNKHLLFEKLITSNCLNNLCLKAIKATIVDKDSDYSQFKKYKHGEDLLQSLPLFYNASKIVYIDKALYNYRMNQASITNTVNLQKYIDLSVVWGKLFEYLKLLRYDTEFNVRLFNRFYCSSMLNCIITIITSNTSKDKKIELLTEMHKIKLFINAMNNTQYRTFSYRYIPVLYLFKNYHYNLLIFYGKIYSFFRKIRNTFRKRVGDVKI